MDKTSEQYKAVGAIHHLGELRVISDKFSLREFTLILGADTDYPQTVLFQVANKKLDLLEGLQPGATVTAHFNLRGREWVPKDGTDTRYFNSLDVWRIERTEAPPF